MARPVRITLTPDAADADGISTSQTPAAGGEQNLTITGAFASGGVATMDLGRRVLITAAADETSRTFTITGTNHSGVVISEAVTGPNATTASSVKDYLTVTQVTVDDDTTGAVTVGTSGVLSTQWVQPNIHASPFNIGFGVEVSGTIAFDVEHTFSDLELSAAPTVFNHAAVAAQTANVDDNYAFPVAGYRLTINSFTAGASVTLAALQAGISSN